MIPRFREDKVADMTCRFLKLSDGTMNYMKLLKLMYIVERSAILTWGRSVTFDRFVSMRHGPVMSGTYDLLIEPPPHDGISNFHERISVSNYEATLLNDEGDSRSLSEVEIDLIEEVYAEHRSKDQWQLRTYTHTFPEWENPHGSSKFHFNQEHS